MTSRRILLISSAALALTASMSGFAFADDKMPVVATFSILGDMVEQVGGDRISVTTLVGPDGDAHVYEPTPADAKAVAAAKVVFTNGFHFEGWMPKLFEAAEYKGPIVVATTGLTPNRFIEDGVETDQDDPHAWQSLRNGHTYVVNITAGLIAADPAGADYYTQRSTDYLAQIDALDAEVKAAVQTIPEANRIIVTSHDAFGYFGQEYGMKFLAPEGVSTEAEASAADVAKVIAEINTRQIPAVFMENITDPRLLEQITSETKAKVGGKLFSDALSPPDGEGATYLDMFRHNITTFTAALGSS